MLEKSSLLQAYDILYQALLSLSLSLSLKAKNCLSLICKCLMLDSMFSIYAVCECTTNR